MLVTIITGGRKEDEEGNERVPENGERENRSGGESQGRAATHGDDQSSEGGPAATVGDACYEQLQGEYETPASASSHQAATLRKAPRGKT